MTDKKDEEVDLECHKCFMKIPWSLRRVALETLNKQFYTFRAGHIQAVRLGRGAELLSANIYHPIKKIAIHEAGHVMAIWYGGSMNSVSRATIKQSWARYHKPRKHITPIRKYPLDTQAKLFEELCFCLSGRIAESMFFPEEKAHFPYFIDYERSDIHKAVNVAYYMTKTEHGFTEDSDRWLSKEVLEDISCYLIRGYEATTDLLKKRAKLLLEVALKLLRERTLELDSLQTLLGQPKRRKKMSLYDQFCAFSMKLRPLARKRYSLNKLKRSKNVKKRKAKGNTSVKKKKSTKKSQASKLRQNKNLSAPRKRSDSIARKKRITNNGQVITVFN